MVYLIVGVFSFGMVVVFLFWLAFKISPPGGPPQYILDMEANQLLAGLEHQAAEAAVEALVEDVKSVTPAKSSRTTIDDEVLTAFNAYKAQCLIDRKTPLGLGRWLYNFDPDLHKRVFDED